MKYKTMKDNKIEDWKDVVVDDKDNKWINPKMLLDKDELIKGVADLFKGTQNAHKILRSKIPSYYIGNNGYEARKVVSGFDLSYNVGTAVTYLLRAKRKHDTPIDCITKAIAHLEFELERIKEDE